MASNAWIMWENILPDATAVTEEAPAVAGWPLVHATHNWNTATAYRYQATGSSTLNLDFNFGVGVTKEPDTVAAAPYVTDGARLINSVWYSDNGAAWSAAKPGAFGGAWAENIALYSTQPFATYNDWSGKGDHQYWRIRLHGGNGRQIGVMSLGRKFEIGIGGLPPSLEPFPERVQAERVMSHSGYPLGSNVTAIERTFTMDISNPGLSVSGFFEPASGLTWQDFLDHAQGLGKLFWFCWNPDFDYPGEPGFGDHQLTSVFLCRLISAPTPIEWTTARRGLTMTFAAYNRQG